MGESTLTKDYVCLKPMEEYRDMPVAEMGHRRQEDLTNCPVPNRSYKIPRALRPSLKIIIVEKLGLDQGLYE